MFFSFPTNFQGQMADYIKLNRKLNALRKFKTASELEESDTVELYNFTEYEIPTEVEHLLRYAPNLGLGWSGFSSSEVP